MLHMIGHAIFGLVIGLLARAVMPGRQHMGLILTMILGATFLGIKAVEYKAKYDDQLIPGRLIPSRPFKPKVAEPGDTDPHKLHLIEGANVNNVQLFYWIISP